MSLWNETVELPEFPELDGDIKADVLIIGGGISGLLCSYILKQRGIDNLVLEAERIGSGTTSGTTAVITAQHSNVYTDIVRQFDRKTAGFYLKANMEAFEKYRQLAETMDFEFEEAPSYIYSTTDKKQLMIEAAILKDLGADAEYTEDTELPFDVAGAVRFARAGKMHPLKFVGEISRGLDIREHTCVRKVKDNVAYTDKGNVRADKIITATNYPIINTRGLYPAKLYRKRSYVMALDNVPVIKGTYADTFARGMYFRSCGDKLIVGGGDHRTGAAGDGFDMVREFVRGVMPDAREVCSWAAQDCMSLDGIPYIGCYSPAMKDVYVVSGFNEWGMTSAMAAAGIIADKIEGRENGYDKIFAPDRRILRKQLASNAAETIINFLNPTLKRCTHMGCALKKNEAENTWDCPCHGSRFDENGNVIDNPALISLKRIR